MKCNRNAKSSRFFFRSISICPSVCLLSLSCMPSCCFIPRCRKRSFDHRQVSRTPRKDTEHLPSTLQGIGCTRSLTKGTDRRIEGTVDIAVVVPVDRTYEQNRRREPPLDQGAEVRSMTLVEEGCKLEAPMSVWRFSRVNLIYANI